MKISFWGVRGSLACSGPEVLRHGGNTACIAVELDNDHIIILDAGTGINHLGDVLIRRQRTKGVPQTCSIILSHGHWDHIMGLPFFKPLYDPAWKVTVYAREGIGGCGLAALMENLFNPALFPVPWHSLRDSVHLHELPHGENIAVQGANIILPNATHAAGSTACRVEADGYSVFYSGDHELGMQATADAEPSAETNNQSALDTQNTASTQSAPPPLNGLSSSFFKAMRGADIAIVDSMYTLAEYARHQGWGHSAQEQWPPLAELLDVKMLIFTHFNPSHSDDMLDDAFDDLRIAFPNMATRMAMAYEGLMLPDATMHLDVPEHTICPRCETTNEFLNMSEMGHILDRLLDKARALTNADAGTFYVKEEGRLVFAYSQNETLYTASEWARQQYLNSSLPIDNTSIAGFVALHATTLNIHDVRKLPDGVPYSFNCSFDEMTGYRTVSMCSIPLHSLEGNLVGVLQLINCKTAEGVRPFTTRLLRLCQDLCQVGAQAIERGMRIQDMILRMLQTAALRDPTETGGHVMRVGAMVAELYQKWGERQGMTINDMRERKGHLRLAAMLHDVGKVGIADAILKKPGRLNAEELLEMETHAYKGAQLFGKPRNEVDTLARNIALHHHQKWNGEGYTGNPAEPKLVGTAIPLEARLTAVADVFDALVSPRCYKKPWPVEKALELLQQGAGKHFDPEVIAAFIDIQDTMIAIRTKYLG